LNFETTDCDVLLLERFLMRSFHAVGVLVLATLVLQSLPLLQLLQLLLTVAVSLQLLLLLVHLTLQQQQQLLPPLIEGVFMLTVKERTLVLTMVMALVTPWAKLGVLGHRQV
jgi:hypothetical protein